jgi:hypothetical protein
MQLVHTTFGLEQSAMPFALITMYEVVKFESCIGASRVCATSAKVNRSFAYPNSILYHFVKKVSCSIPASSIKSLAAYIAT